MNTKSIKNIKTNPFLLIALVVAMLLGTNIVKAQFYITGDNPACTRWNYINTQHYKIVYPQEIDSLAQRYAWLLESGRSRIMAGLKTEPERIPVVLNPYTTLSNGTVVWAPKRIELYTTPPANRGYAQNWERQLVLHESRHVGQMTNFTKGIFKPLSWILGEQVAGAAVGLYASKWLLEGDAVVAETELSDAGRGRCASFMEYYRASFLLGHHRSWERWKYGSFRQYYPNHYAFGYMLNSTMRMKSGNYLAAGDLFENYVKHFYYPNVHNYAMEKVTGIKQKKLLDASIDMYTDMWSEDYSRRGVFTEPVELNHKKSNYYYEYSNPIEIGKDSLIFIRYSNDNATELVMLCQSEEFKAKHKNGEKLLKVMSGTADGLEINGKTIYWIESNQDKRWSKRVYNNLYSYNLENGKVVKMSDKTSYNNPVISDCGEFLAVVEYPFDGGSNIVILNAQTGERVLVVPAPHSGQVTECAWIGNTIYSLVITERGLGLFASDIGDDLKKTEGSVGRGMNADVQWQVVLKEQFKNICSLASDGEWLYFESDMDGVSNIYFFNPKSEELRRATNSKFAAHDPYYTNGKLFYTDLRLNAKIPVYTDVKLQDNDVQSEPYVQDKEIKNGYVFEVAETLKKQAGEYFAKNGISEADSLNASISRYQPKRYRKGLNLFRIHSWAPVYYNVDKIMSMSFDPVYEAVSLGATLYSQNTLGTAVTMLGYSFREGHHAGHFSFEYSGLYPVFKVSAHYNAAHREKYRIDEFEGEIGAEVTPTKAPLLELTAQAYVPINFSGNGWQRGLIPQVQWDYENNAFYTRKKDDYVDRQQVTYGVQYYQMQPVAEAEIFPKWGFSAVAKGAFSPNGKENFGRAFSGYAYLYVPGFFNCHGIRLSGSYQKQFVKGKWMYLDNLVSMPRGHDANYGTDYYKYSIDYAIPVNFNGLNLGWFAYIKRMQIIPFADIASVKGASGKWHNLNSYGCDLLFDAVVFHIGVPVAFGLRYSRTDYGKVNIGVLAAMSLF